MQSTKKLLNEQELISLLLKNNNIKTIVDIASSLGMKNWYLAAGALSQTYWNYLHGFNLDEHIKDYDLVYFDSEHNSYEDEDLIIKKATTLFSTLAIDVEIRNQARVHLWYKDKFGRDIDPYNSTEDAIDSWPTTATAVGLTKNASGEYQLYSSFGISDLVSGIIRPNKKLVDQKVYEDKTARWKSIWDGLEIMPW